MNNELATSSGGTIQLIDQLTELNKKFDEIILTMKQDRGRIESHIEDMQKGLREVRQYSHMSEEAVLEKQINEAFKNLNACNSRIEIVINAVTKIVTAKIVAESGQKPDGLVDSPIEISRFKKG